VQADLVLGAKSGQASLGVNLNGGLRQATRVLKVEDVAQVITLRILDRHYKQLEKEAAERHERGRLQRELDKMQRDARRAAERLKRQEEARKRAQQMPVTPRMPVEPLPLLPPLEP